jgi:hypothetical protein
MRCLPALTNCAVSSPSWAEQRTDWIGADPHDCLGRALTGLPAALITA